MQLGIVQVLWSVKEPVQCITYLLTRDVSILTDTSDHLGSGVKYCLQSMSDSGSDTNVRIPPQQNHHMAAATWAAITLRL